MLFVIVGACIDGVADGAVDALVEGGIVHPIHFFLHCWLVKHLKKRRS